MGMGLALTLPGLRLIARPDFLRLAGPEARNNACDFTRANSAAATPSGAIRALFKLQDAKRRWPFSARAVAKNPLDLAYGHQKQSMAQYPAFLEVPGRMSGRLRCFASSADVLAAA
jgi:hypothetical protein